MTVLQLLDDIKENDIRVEITEREKATEVIFEYLSICEGIGIPHKLVGYYVEELIKNITKNGNNNYSVEVLLFCYFKLKGTENGRILEAIMQKHGFKYYNSVHNAVYYLLGQERDLKLINTDPLLWPGVNKISRNGEFYTLETELGRIEVSKAAPKFLDTKSAYIFEKSLMHKCHSRTLEFVKENKSSRAVLSIQSNFFHGGHYHSYVEMGDAVIDLAANAYYDSKEFAEKILHGDVLAKLYFDEIQEMYSKIETPVLRDKEKLYVLTSFYDMKNRLSKN